MNTGLWQNRGTEAETRAGMERKHLAARLRDAADRKKARLCRSGALSEPQRKLALELLRQQTEDEMRRALGQQEFFAFKAFHYWWFRALSVAA